MKHDPTRHISYLQQCLSQDKRRLGILIGAGCPVAIRVDTNEGQEPLVPDIKGLTDFVTAKIEDGELRESFEKINQHLADDGHKVVNIESQLSFIRALKAVAGLGDVRDLSVAQLNNLEAAICSAISDRVDRVLPLDENPYAQMAAWIGAVSRSEPVEVFTTNYDLLIEQALERAHIPFFDGFSGVLEAFLDINTIDSDDLPPRWTRLWKMHGSINWCLSDSQRVCRGGVSRANCIIHPSHLKYDESRRMPYLAMIDRLKSFVRNPSSVVVTCGYSFGDEHLNACIAESLERSPRSAVFGLMFGELGSYPYAVNLAKKVSNLSVLGRDKAVIGTRELVWDNREPPDLGRLAGALELSIDNEDDEEKTAKFHLGDFACFGRFLASLIGKESMRDAHAE